MTHASWQRSIAHALPASAEPKKRVVPSADAAAQTRRSPGSVATEEPRQWDLDRVEGLCAHDLVVARGEGSDVRVHSVAEDDERARVGVDDPVVRNGVAVQRAELLDEVESRSRW